MNSCVNWYTINIPSASLFTSKRAQRPPLILTSVVKRGSTSTTPPPPTVDPQQLAFLQSIGVTDPKQAENTLRIASAKAPSLTVKDLETSCLLLVDEANVPLKELRTVITKRPEILGYKPSVLKAQIEGLKSAWAETQLAKVISSYPAILSLSFNTNLLRAMETLEDSGLSKTETGKILILQPSLTSLSAFELSSRLREIDMDYKTDSAARRFLVTRPECLTELGARKLTVFIDFIVSHGVTRPKAQSAIIKCHQILDTPQEHIDAVLTALADFGLDSEPQIGDIVQSNPALLKGNTPRTSKSTLIKIQQVLKMLKAFKISAVRVAAYPRVFTHHPGQYIGPRLAYLRQYYREDFETLKLVTILSRSDYEFASQRRPIKPHGHYDEFKKKWIAKFGAEFA